MLLTEKELRLTYFVSEGMKNKEVAQETGTTEGSVKDHLIKIFDKLGFHNRVELAMWYVKQQHDKQV